MISAQEMMSKLWGVQLGTTVFVSYEAGRSPTPRAIREAKKADVEGYPKRWFIGTITSIRTTKKGDPVFTVFSQTRYNEDDTNASGHYRTMNPQVGTLLALEVL